MQRGPSAPRLFDCFIFATELDLLQWRLETLDDTVDVFVLVEAPLTHAGQSKPLYYADNRIRFSRWADRIVHVVAELPEGSASDPEGSAWARTHAQRQAILTGLDGAHDDDIVMVSDVDEIPSPRVVQSLKQAPPLCPVSLAMRNHSLCLDLTDVRAPWTVPCTTQAFAAKKRDIRDVQGLRLESDKPIIPDAGWHMSWLLPEESAQGKLEAYGHTKLNTDAWRSPTHLRRCRALGVDLFGRRLLQRVSIEALPTPIWAAASENPRLLAPPGSGELSLLAIAYWLHVPLRWNISARILDRVPLSVWVLLVPITLPYWMYRKARKRFGPRLRSLLSTSHS